MIERMHVCVYDESHQQKPTNFYGQIQSMENLETLTKPVLTEVIFDEMYSNPRKGSVRLECLPHLQTLHLQWYGILSHEDHTKFANMTIDHIRQKHATRWIGDVSHIIEPLPVDIAHFIADTWFPQAVKAGISKLAIIMPAVEKVKPSTNKIAEVLALKHSNLLKTFPTVSFNSRQEAREWVCA
jgi:hypothetical protein